MDIGCVFDEGFADDLVDEFHDRRFGIIGIEHIDFFSGIDIDALALTFFEELFKGIGADAIAEAEGIEDEFPGSHDELHGALDGLSDGGSGDVVEGVVGGEGEDAFFAGDLEEVVSEGEAGGEFLVTCGESIVC